MAKIHKQGGDEYTNQKISTHIARSLLYKYIYRCMYVCMYVYILCCLYSFLIFFKNYFFAAIIIDRPTKVL